MKINDECTLLCRHAEPSVFCKRSASDFPEFKWETLKFVNELKSKSPTLYELLMLLVSHSDHRNESKRGDSHHQAICMAVGVMLKKRNREMTGLIANIHILTSVFSHVHKHICIYA